MTAWMSSLAAWMGVNVSLSLPSAALQSAEELVPEMGCGLRENDDPPQGSRTHHGSAAIFLVSVRDMPEKVTVLQGA